MHEPAQLLIILSAISLCALLAHRLSVAPPISFLLGGILLACIPGFARVTIDPELMLVVFLPPILMEAAFHTSIRDFRAALWPILRLAVGLVILTAAATALVVVYVLPGSTWALGFVLGAIISPPDAAAATSALKNIRLPKRISTILEGESLVNDATGIVLFKFAVGAVLAGSFSLADAGIDFAWKAAAGVVIGLVVAWLFVKLYPLFRNPSAEIIASFIPPYASYILAEHLHGSGVLAVVAAGLYVGWHGPRILSANSRLPMESIWNMAVYFLNALAFLLIGLQLPSLIIALRAYETSLIFGATAGVIFATLVVRFLYVYAATYFTYWLYGARRGTRGFPAWQNVLIVGWTGMRGVVTLALALALPRVLPDGSAFPYRDLLIFISVSMILFTLVVQGLTLPWLARRLRLHYDRDYLQEEWLARTTTTRKVLALLDEITECSDIYQPALQRIRQHYQERLQSLGDGPNSPLDPDQHRSLLDHPLIMAENRIWHEALKIERDTLIGLRQDFSISDGIMHEIMREIDLLASRFEYVEQKVEDEALPSMAARGFAFLLRKTA